MLHFALIVPMHRLMQKEFLIRHTHVQQFSSLSPILLTLHGQIQECMTPEGNQHNRQRLQNAGIRVLQIIYENTMGPTPSSTTFGGMNNVRKHIVFDRPSSTYTTTMPRHIIFDRPSSTYTTGFNKGLLLVEWHVWCDIASYSVCLHVWCDIGSQIHNVLHLQREGVYNGLFINAYICTCDLYSIFKE